MAVTQQMLTDAREAYHLLVIGQSVTKFRDQNGEEVTYYRADAAKLLAYIKWLEADLAGDNTPRRGNFMQVWM